MEHNAKNICKTVISGKEQNLNKQQADFRISILFQYCRYILAKFNTFSKPRRNPVIRNWNIWLTFIIKQWSVYFASWGKHCWSYSVLSQRKLVEMVTCCYV